MSVLTRQLSSFVRKPSNIDTVVQKCVLRRDSTCPSRLSARAWSVTASSTSSHQKSESTYRMNRIGYVSTDLQRNVSWRQPNLFLWPRHSHQVRSFCSKADDTSSQADDSDTKCEEHSVPIGRIQPRMLIQYTCKVCGGRNEHTFSKQAYTHGIVIVTCEHCNNKHLIADNLGWFKNIQHNSGEIMHKEDENIAGADEESGR